MPRRRAAEKREVLPDAKYGDVVLTKFMNCLMFQGRKSTAEGIVYGALETIEKRTGQEGVKVFHEALENGQADGRGALAPGRRGDLPGADRSARVAAPGTGDPLDHRQRAQPLGVHDGREAVQRIAGRREFAGRSGEEERGHAPHGGGEQGLLPLPLVRIRLGKRSSHGPQDPNLPLPKHRHHGAHRCGQDHDHRAHTVLHRPLLQNRRGA